MPSQASSSQGSEKNKNLIAAKASLGISTAGSKSSSHYRNPVKQNSINSVSSSLSGSASSNELSRKFPASSSSIRSSSTASEGKKSVRINSGNFNNNSKRARFDETSFSKSAGSHVTNYESGSKANTSFDNYFEEKIDLSSIKEESSEEIDQSRNVGATLLQSSEAPHDPGTNELFDDPKTNLSQYQGSGYETNTNFSQGGDLYNSNNMNDSNNIDFSQEAELNDSYNYTAERSVDENSQRSREDFEPQRFDEMRMLLSAITPMQLDALIQEIFGNDGPPGWSFKGKKSKQGFRKDAYLSELTLEELQNFARRIDNLGLDYCWSSEEALDLIAIEFERLVSLRLNEDDESNHMDSPPPHHQNYVQSSSSVSYEGDQMTHDSGTSEGDNLRRSLRACSFSELRLVAERLRLDPSVCVTKDELILMIENSMPDLMADSISQDSQSQPLIEDFENYHKPIQQNHRHQQQQQHTQQVQHQQHRRRSGEERRKKVKFSDGENRRKVKFSNDTKVGKAQPISTRKGNYVDGPDLEAAPLVETNVGKGSSRLSGMRQHVWKVVALMLLLLGLIIGLTFGLPGRESRGGNDANGEERPYVLLPENDPFFSDYFASSRTYAPSPRPSQSTADTDSELISPNEGQPSSISGGVFVTNREPTMKPTSFPSSATYMPTQRDTETMAPTQTITIQPTNIPTLMPADAKQIETEMPSAALPKFSITTAQPTPLSPYPLLGPYEEAGMRMVLYGISELSEMGKTQFKMLTAAYVEQFYNDEGRGTDAFQNIVFDVSASIEITNVELPPTRRRGLGARSLQSVIIITFTMNLSYRSFSNDLDAKIVSERPFFEESLHADFIQFLRDNNAARFVGEISDITSIFRGDDIPEIMGALAQELNGSVEEDMRVESNSPSRKPVAAAVGATATEPTPEETPAPKPLPQSLSSAPQPSFSAFYPTPNPTRQPTNPRGPNKSKPTPGKVIHTYSPVK